MNKLIAGNWKHNPTSLGEAIALTEGVAALSSSEDVELLVCPPSPYLFSVLEKKGSLSVGAQNVSLFGAGAHTGEVGAEILKDLGATYVIIGHSERRARGEHDEEVAKKVTVALEAGLRPIVCVGEPLSIRELGEEAIYAFLQQQLAVLPEKAEYDVAYEPLWAISGGDVSVPPATPEVAEEACAFVSTFLEHRGVAGRVLYGGSVKPENAGSLIEQEHIDGFLVGGASLDAEKFGGIVDAAR